MNIDKAKQYQQENLDLMIRKNMDYGSKNIEITGTYGVAVRLQDKVSRILNLSAKGTDANYESIHDTFMDIANYGLIGQLLLSGDFGEDNGAQHANEAPEVKEDTVGDVGWVSPSYPGYGYVSYAKLGSPLHELVHVPAYEIPVQEDEENAEPNLMVYLAGPIDQVTENEAKSWRVKATDALVANGLAVFNPATAVSQGWAARRAVHQICRDAVLNSGLLLAYLPGEYRAFGTIRELEYATSIGVPVVVVSDYAGKSIFSEDLVVLDSLDDAVEVITQVLVHGAEL